MLRLLIFIFLFFAIHFSFAQKNDDSATPISTTATRAQNDLALAQLKARLDSGQVGIRKLKAELEGATISQRIVLNAISAKNNASVAKTDALLSQLKMQSELNKSEIKRLKTELENALNEAASKLTEMNSKNTVSNAEAGVMVAQLKTKSDSDHVEINRLKASLEKIKATTINTSAIPRSPGNPVRTSESDYFLDENGKPVGTEYYVVLGTFSSKENAERFRASNVIKGHVNTKVFQNQITKSFSVYGLKTNNKADAETERIKFKPEYPDVWILKLE